MMMNFENLTLPRMDNRGLYYIMMNHNWYGAYNDDDDGEDGDDDDEKEEEENDDEFCKPYKQNPSFRNGLFTS